MITQLQPPTVIQLDRPVLFLAGPIQGAPNWQSDARKLICQHAGKDLIIANPRRDSLVDKNFNYTEQVEWERQHLLTAGEGINGGCILYWLGLEQYVVAGRSYAQTTRWELAEWVTRHQFANARLSVGIEEGFSGARYARHRLKDTPKIKIANTLEQTVINALELI